MKLPETQSVVDLGRIDTAAHTGAVDEVTTAMGYAKQNVTNIEAILVMLGGSAIQLRTAQSISGVVEEAAYQQFSISIMDVDSGAIASADIDITGISAEIAKSTGGAAFSTAGLTAITFAKDDGRVYVSYEFKAAEWAVGDVYRVTVSGIEATIGTDTAYIPAMVWTNFITLDADLKAAVDGIQTDLDNATDGLGALKILIDENQTDLNSVLEDVGDFSARAQNLKSLLAVLGVPDVDDDTLYKLLYTDMLADATHGLAQLATDIGTNQTDLNSILADVGDFSARTNNLKTLLAVLGVPDVDDDTLYKLLYTDMLAHGTHGLAALKALVDTMQGNVTDILADTGTAGVVLGTKVAAFKTLAGENQIAITTEDLNQAAGAYDLFTGTTKAILLKSFSIKLPTEAAGGAITSISIQTDDVTPAVIISAADGAVGNLTSEAEFSWTGAIRINVGTKIQLTIAGGAHASEYITTIMAECVAIEDTGYLAV